LGRLMGLLDVRGLCRAVQLAFGNSRPLMLSYSMSLKYTLSAALLKYYLAPHED
jgi:hypothetical protein